MSLSVRSPRWQPSARSPVSPPSSSSAAFRFLPAGFLASAAFAFEAAGAGEGFGLVGDGRAARVERERDTADARAAERAPQPGMAMQPGMMQPGMMQPAQQGGSGFDFMSAPAPGAPAGALQQQNPPAQGGPDFSAFDFM